MRFDRRELLRSAGGVTTMGLWSCLKTGRAPLLPQRFDGALFRFRDSKTALHGFIDQNGNVRIDARFAAAGSFAEDRAVVRLASGEMAIIDGRGEVLFQIHGEGSIESCFADGLLGVRVSNPFCAYLDRTGKERFRVCNGYPDPASEGRVMFTDQEHHLHGYVDLAGEVIIAARYASVGRFSEGLAAVSLPSGRAEQDGYIDPRGRWVIQPGFDGARPFSCERARVRGGFIDKAGKRVISNADDNQVRYEDFAEGLARYQDWRGEHPRVGFIDTAGKVVLASQFGDASDFSEGLAAAAEPDGRWGFIDRSGHWVIGPSFHLAEPMRHGLARVEVWKDGRNESGFTPVRVGYVDRSGRWVFEWKDERRPPSLI